MPEQLRRWCRRDDVPVVIVMKAMGVESDQEAASLVGSEADFSALFLPSLEAAAEAGVVTQQQALQWLGVRDCGCWVIGQT